MSVLDSVENYMSLGDLDREQLLELASDLRRRICEVVLENGGHLASSLGSVEIILAMLRVFDPLQDRIVFDVGHQAYAYKILTDRKQRFPTIRQWDGLSGYPDPSESPFDHFNAGHSSKSLSAALGFAKSRDILQQNHHVVALIGDGAILNGVALEALNNIKEANTRIICVLNDNQMAINRRVGGMADHIARLSVHPAYKKLKDVIKHQCNVIPGGEGIEEALIRARHSIKGILQPSNMFEEMGFSYWGPFDGHDTLELEKIFDFAKRYEKPLLIHVRTNKGQGYEPAEKRPEFYHGVSPASASSPPQACSSSWSRVMADEIEVLASEDKRIVCLTAAMKEGGKLQKFAERFPERFFDVGIAEAHLLTYAAGMAAAGLRPVVSIYSTFLQRAMDQLVHDIAMQRLPVILAVDRAGLVGEDGETHHGVLDIAWASSIPHLGVASPRDAVDMRFMLRKSVDLAVPQIIRFPRGEAPSTLFRPPESCPYPWGTAETLAQGETWGIAACGSTAPLAMRVREQCCRESLEPPAVIDLRFLKPLDLECMDRLLGNLNLLVVLEEGAIEGGVGQKLSSRANQKGLPCRVEAVGIPDFFVPHGKRSRQWSYCGLTPEKVVDLYKAFAKGKAGSAARQTGIS